MDFLLLLLLLDGLLLLIGKQLAWIVWYSQPLFYETTRAGSYILLIWLAVSLISLALLVYAGAPSQFVCSSLEPSIGTNAIGSKVPDLLWLDQAAEMEIAAVEVVATNEGYISFL